MLLLLLSSFSLFFLFTFLLFAIYFHRYFYFFVCFCYLFYSYPLQSKDFFGIILVEHICSSDKCLCGNYILSDFSDMLNLFVGLTPTFIIQPIFFSWFTMIPWYPATNFLLNSTFRSSSYTSSRCHKDKDRFGRLLEELWRASSHFQSLLQIRNRIRPASVFSPSSASAH